MRRRQKPRLDYSKLHSTGVVSIKETDNTDSELSQLFADSLSLKDNTMDEVQKLKVDISVLSSDILDLIDENPIDEHLDKDVINKLEEVRSTFKQSNLHLQIAEPQVYAEKFETSYQKTLSIVKAYIKSSKECKIKIDLADIKAKTNEKIQKENHLSTRNSIENWKLLIIENYLIQRNHKAAIVNIYQSESIVVKMEHHKKLNRLKLESQSVNYLEA